MSLNKMINRRRSVRRYSGESLSESELREITQQCMAVKPLYDGIKVKIELADREEIKSVLPFITPRVLCLYSEVKEGYLENAGFVLQQMDLWLQEKGYGTCWVGMGKPGGAQTDRNDGLKFVMMMTLGKTDVPYRNGSGDFKRKTLGEISDRGDERLECVRLAPSSVNSQPWYFVCEGDTFHVYQNKKGLFGAAFSDMNRIDMGIALAHLYVCYPESFVFIKGEGAEIAGKQYIGSVNI